MFPGTEQLRRAALWVRAFVLLEDPPAAAHPHRRRLERPARCRRPGAGPVVGHVCVTPVARRARRVGTQKSRPGGRLSV
jgi:hypothetical protein